MKFFNCCSKKIAPAENYTQLYQIKNALRNEFSHIVEKRGHPDRIAANIFTLLDEHWDKLSHHWIYHFLLNKEKLLFYWVLTVPGIDKNIRNLAIRLLGRLITHEADFITTHDHSSSPDKSPDSDNIAHLCNDVLHNQRVLEADNDAIYDWLTPNQTFGEALTVAVDNGRLDFSVLCELLNNMLVSELKTETILESFTDTRGIFRFCEESGVNLRLAKMNLSRRDPNIQIYHSLLKKIVLYKEQGDLVADAAEEIANDIRVKPNRAANATDLTEIEVFGRLARRLHMQLLGTEPQTAIQRLRAGATTVKNALRFKGVSPYRYMQNGHIEKFTPGEGHHRGTAVTPKCLVDDLVEKPNRSQSPNA